MRSLKRDTEGSKGDTKGDLEEGGELVIVPTYIQVPAFNSCPS